MILDMDVWDGLLLMVAAYISVTSLVRLMRQRRDQLLADLRRQSGRPGKEAVEPPRDNPGSNSQPPRAA